MLESQIHSMNIYIGEKPKHTNIKMLKFIMIWLSKGFISTEMSNIAEVSWVLKNNELLRNYDIKLK